ncbi:MAG: BMC domain-containing protein [Acidimicrobiia bacterium]|nr:BMC domain-containing protein [Acidimicrobiia bacterium]MDH5615703.1 BMC domain-containing protein [Acidimicrobiia bacterium]
MIIQPALALLEFDSIAAGIQAGDAMVKRAPLDLLKAGTVQPGKYLVLIGGQVADVEEAIDAARSAEPNTLVDIVFLPDVHPDVVAAVAGARRADEGEALGVVETMTVAAVIQAADAGVKGARVTLRELRMADGLGGKGYLLFGGTVADVEAGVAIGAARVGGQLIRDIVIAQLHPEMKDNLSVDGRFEHLVRSEEE